MSGLWTTTTTTTTTTVQSKIALGAVPAYPLSFYCLLGGQGRCRNAICKATTSQSLYQNALPSSEALALVVGNVGGSTLLEKHVGNLTMALLGGVVQGCVASVGFRLRTCTLNSTALLRFRREPSSSGPWPPMPFTSRAALDRRSTSTTGWCPFQAAWAKGVWPRKQRGSGCDAQGHGRTCLCQSHIFAIWAEGLGRLNGSFENRVTTAIYCPLGVHLS